MLTVYLGERLTEDVFVFVEDLHRTAKSAHGPTVEVDKLKLRIVAEKVGHILNSYSDMEYSYLYLSSEVEEMEEQEEALKEVLHEAKGQLEDFLSEHPDLKENEMLLSLLQTLERVRYIECPSSKDTERPHATE
jgi:predicted RNA-binding protein with EMAP domain